MSVQRSFTEYIKKRFDNDFWTAAESYLEENADSLDIELRRIHCSGETEISDVKVEHVWVEDKPGMEIQFDVAVSIWFETHKGDYYYDDYDENIVWIMVHCRGDLDSNPDDFEVLNYESYNRKSRTKSPMDDSLVPIIPYKRMEKEAEEFLKQNYSKTLRVPFRGQSPVWVNPTILAEKIGLTITSRRIKKIHLYLDKYILKTQIRSNIVMLRKRCIDSFWWKNHFCRS